MPPTDTNTLGTLLRANLVASDDFLTRAVNLLSGQFYPIGSVLGRVKYSCPTTGTIHTGDSGNGTCTLVKPGPKIKNGTYTITCAEISSYQSISIATFNVTDPSGAIVGSFEIGNVSGNTADFDSDQLRLKVTTGSTIFVATTDYFTILVNWGVPATGTAGSNTGNGTCPTVLGRKNTIKGVYTATCSAVVEDEGVFDVTDPNGSALGSFHACAYFERTGNGVLSQIEAGYAKKPGAYTVVCTAAASDGGKFLVYDPNGDVVCDNSGTAITLTLPGTSLGSARFVSDQIGFLLADGSQDFIVGDTFSIDCLESDGLYMAIQAGSTDFIVGDKFTVTVTNGNRDCKTVDSTAVDGSQDPYAVLLEDKDASSADQAAPVLIEGEVNERRLVFGGSDTIETHRDALRLIGIDTVNSVSK